MSDVFKQAACPYCGREMSEVHYAIWGAVRFCHSREAMAAHISRWRPDVEVGAPQTLTHNQDERLHTVVGNSGLRRGRWPKEGFYCSHCGTMTVRLKPQ